MLFIDEIDNLLIHFEMLEGLSEVILVETMLCENQDRWIGLILMDLETGERYMQVILKNGEPVQT